MANAWNELTWGIGNYGEQNNHTEVVSSVSASSSVGDFQVETEQRIEVSSLSLSANIGSATSDVLNNGWGARVWGFSVWGSVGDVVLTGQQLAAVTGQLTASISIDVDVNGISAQTNIGDTTSRVDANPTIQGLSLQTFTGNEDTEGNAVVTSTGVSATANTGQATIDPTYLVGEGWGRDTWGNWAWGVNYSVLAAGGNGISISAITGNEDAFTDVTVEVQTAGELQTAIEPVGTQANSDNEIAVGELLTTAQGDVTIEGTALVEPTGVSLSTNIGDAVGGTIQEVPVTGISANIFVGNEDTSGNANVFVTGIQATGSVGDIVPISTYEATGSSASTSIGSVTAVGGAVVIPTGIDLTISTGSPNIVAWAEVDTGTDVTWTEVDLAA